MPPAGWKDVLWRVKNDVSADEVGLVASSVAFFALLSLAPTLLAAVSIYGLLVAPEQAQQQLTSLADVLPRPAAETLTEQLGGVASRAPSTLGWGAGLSVLAALWGASSGTAKMMKAIGIAYDEEDDRGFIAQRALALALTLGFLAIGAVALATVAVLPALLEGLGLDPVVRDLVQYGRWPLLALLVMGGLAVLYAIAPHRARPRWRWVTWGSVLATVLWIGASIAFSYYVQNLGSFGETYGSLAGVIVLMLWLYLSAYVFLLGAELNSELEAQTARDSTTGEPKPMGQRGARKADHLGPTRR